MLDVLWWLQSTVINLYYEYEKLRQTYGAYERNIPNTGNLYKIL